MPDAFIVAGCRTPTGRLLGGLSSVPAPQLGAAVIREAISRSHLSSDRVLEVIMGNVLTAGVGQAPARQAALAAGCSNEVAALTINKVCGSGLKAVMLADQAIRAGDADVIVAGGMESMSRAPHLLLNTRAGWKFGNQEAVDAMLHDGLFCAWEQTLMGNIADETARQHSISRTEQDAFAAESHRRAINAARQKAFAAEIIPVTIHGRRHERVIDTDEGPRDNTTPESLANLAAAFDKDGTVTAGNASQISDGAAAVVVTNRQVAAQIDSPIKARIVATATSGGAAKDLFVAPVAAIESVLAKAGITMHDVDLVELNEAFAAQCLACMRPLDLGSEKVNVRGGAIALGHPIGASGARILVTLLYALRDLGKERGVAALCLGGGNAVAMLVERV